MSNQSRLSLGEIHRDALEAKLQDQRPGCKQAHLDDVSGSWSALVTKRAPKHDDEAGAYCVLEFCDRRAAVKHKQASGRIGTLKAEYYFVYLPKDPP